jgi:hypothetical protein
VAIPVSNPCFTLVRNPPSHLLREGHTKRKVPIAAKRAIPKVYHNAIFITYCAEKLGIIKILVVNAANQKFNYDFDENVEDRMGDK